MTMTIEELKDKLPDVRVEFNGTLYLATVHGRKNKFATVAVHVGTGRYVTAEYSWESIARSVETRRPLIWS